MDSRAELHDLRDTIGALLVQVARTEQEHESRFAQLVQYRDHDFALLRNKIVNLEHETEAIRSDNKHLEEAIEVDATRIFVLEEEGKKKDEQIACLERHRLSGLCTGCGEAQAVPHSRAGQSRAQPCTGCWDPNCGRTASVSGAGEAVASVSGAGEAAAAAAAAAAADAESSGPPSLCASDKDGNKANRSGQNHSGGQVSLFPCMSPECPYLNHPDGDILGFPKHCCFDCRAYNKYNYSNVMHGERCKRERLLNPLIPLTPLRCSPCDGAHNAMVLKLS